MSQVSDIEIADMVAAPGWYVPEHGLTEVPQRVEQQHAIATFDVLARDKAQEVRLAAAGGADEGDMAHLSSAVSVTSPRLLVPSERTGS